MQVRADWSLHSENPLAFVLRCPMMSGIVLFSDSDYSSHREFLSKNCSTVSVRIILDCAARPMLITASLQVLPTLQASKTTTVTQERASCIQPRYNPTSTAGKGLCTSLRYYFSSKHLLSYTSLLGLSISLLQLDLEAIKPPENAKKF